MKTRKFILALAALLLLTAPVASQAQVATKAQAQNDNPDYFVGKWEATVEADRTAKLVLDIVRADGALGAIVSVDDDEPAPAQVTENRNGSITISLDSGSSGYQVAFYIEKGPDNSLLGSIMDMFDFVARRVGD